MEKENITPVPEEFRGGFSLNKIRDNVEILKWVLSLIDEPGNTPGDVKQLINEKICTFEEKKDGSA